MLMGEDGKVALLRESSSILLTGLNWNTEAGNLIKEGLARAVPASSPRPPLPLQAAHLVWIIFLGNGVIRGLAGLGNITTCRH